MEYNYTKEWKQPNKIYRLGALDLTSLFPEGIKLSVIVFISLAIFGVIILGLLSIVKGVTIVSDVFKNSYMIIAIVVAVIIWTLSTLKYDNKSFVSFFVGRFKHGVKRRYQLDHEDIVTYMNEPITYSKVKKRKKRYSN